MIYWAQLLHFYQPPTQSPGVLRKIYRESYKPLIEVLLKYPQARITVNINGVLTEMLHDCGHDDIIDGLKRLVERGQIEFTGSGKYHPILPLIPRKEVERQIYLNSVTNGYFFKNLYDCFFTYDRSFFVLVLETGYDPAFSALEAAVLPIGLPEHLPKDFIEFLL